jgi:hypothetical protein
MTITETTAPMGVPAAAPVGGRNAAAIKNILTKYRQEVPSDLIQPFSDALATAGWRGLEDMAQVKRWAANASASLTPGWGPGQALHIAYRDEAGEDVRYGAGRECFSRIRLYPEDGDIKYLQPAGSGNHLYRPVTIDGGCVVSLARERGYIVVTEGEIDAQWATFLGVPTLGLAGIYNWRKTWPETRLNADGKRERVKGASEPMPDLDTVPWGELDVFIVFDNDPDAKPKTKRQVEDARYRLRKHLIDTYGARVFHGQVPADKVKAGLGDWLCSLHRDGADVLSCAQKMLDSARLADPRPRIVVYGGSLADNIQQLRNALMESNAELYIRGVDLVCLAQSTVETGSTGLTRPAGAPIITAVTEHRLMEFAAAAAAWFKPDGRKDGEHVPVNPPMQLIRTYMAGASERGHRPLRGVVESPIMRQDGSILDAPGYDEATGFYYKPSFDPIDVSERPTRDDALRALEVIRLPLKDFPFDTPADESVAIAAILTPFVRRSLPAAPLFAFDAPKPRTGKSLLLEVVARITTGRPASMMSYSLDPRENEKRMFSALLSGQQIICIDNVDPRRALESPELCSILTQEVYTARVLGFSKDQTVPTSVVWLASGNNLAFASDMADRVIRCRLDAKTENPENRHFERNEDELRAFVLQHRPELVRASLTILRAYHAAGCPDKPHPFGGFAGWSDLVRGALCWLGLTDPCETRANVKADDPVRNAIAAFLTAWHEAFGSEMVTARQVEDAAGRRPDLEYALKQALGDHHKSLGRLCSSVKDAPNGGFTLKRSAEKVSGFYHWKVIRASEV